MRLKLVGLLGVMVLVGGMVVGRVWAKDDLDLQSRLLSNLDRASVYIKSIEEASKKYGVLNTETEASLAEKINWLSDERLKLVATADRDRLRVEARKLAKFWQQTSLELKALKLVGELKRIEGNLKKLEKIQAELNLNEDGNINSKLEIVRDKLETVSLSLDLLVSGGGNEADWERDRSLLREAIRYEKYVLNSLRREIGN